MGDLQVTTTTGADTVLKDAVVAELRGSLRGVRSAARSPPSSRYSYLHIKKQPRHRRGCILFSP
jgi:hypothetical protein